MIRVVLILSVVLAGGGGALGAEGTCAAGIAALAERLPSITDPQMHAVLENDLRHARKEAAEGDEEECTDILHHADKVLARAK